MTNSGKWAHDAPANIGAIVMLGSLVAAELYDRAVPVVLVGADALAAHPAGATISVSATEASAVLRWR